MTHFWSSADVTQTVSLRVGGHGHLDYIPPLPVNYQATPNRVGRQKDDRRDYRRIEYNL